MLPANVSQGHEYDEDDAQSITSARQSTSDASTDDEESDELIGGEPGVSATELTNSGCSNTSSDEEDSPETPRRKHAKVDRNISKEAFRDLLNQLESEETRQLLYPPSLWEQPKNTTSEPEDNNVNEISEYQRLNPDAKMPDLDKFCVYHGLNHKKYPGQYAMLHIVALREGKDTYLLDGDFVLDGRDIALRQVELHEVEVSRLGLGCHSCEGEIWATIKISPEIQIRTRLQKPSLHYQNFWLDFCWIANFARYSVDYLTIPNEEDHLVALDDFKSMFLAHISSIHGDCLVFKQWITRLEGRPDVRRLLSQFVPFIYSHFHKTVDPSVFLDHPLWDEIGCTKVKRIKVEGEPTVVTQNVAAAFLIPFRE